MQTINKAEKTEMVEAIAKYLSAQGVDKEIATSLTSVLQPALASELESFRGVLEELDNSQRRLTEAIGNNEEIRLLGVIPKTIADRPGGKDFWINFSSRDNPKDQDLQSLRTVFADDQDLKTILGHHPGAENLWYENTYNTLAAAKLAMRLKTALAVDNE